MKEEVIYDPISGEISFSSSDKRTSNSNGYVSFSYNGNQYLVHRYAWFYMTGSWPKVFIDHIDGNPSNNRFSNLREADRFQNQHNRRIPSHNKSGKKGVYFDKRRGKWRADIMFRKKKIFLGHFSDVDEAGEAYRKAAEKYQGEFAKNT